MRRLGLIVVVLAVATAAVAFMFGAGTSPPSTPQAAAPEVAAIPSPPPTSASTISTLAPTTTSTSAAPQAAIYLVWVSGGLPAEMVAGMAAAFDQVSVVKGDSVELLNPDGGIVPLDALALDPLAHRPFDSGHLDALEPGTVILGETSAGLRKVGPGDELAIAGHGFEVGGVVPDHAVAAAEVVFAVSDPNLPVSTDRYALVATDENRDHFEATVRSLAGEETPVRIRSETEVPWLRHADSVLPQALIKQVLGEFSYANRSGSDFDQDQVFQDRHIVTGPIPLLGEVACHAVVTEMLVGAMGQLIDEGLEGLVDPGGFAGCWYPRFVRTESGSPAGVSRHAWGAAVDLNAPANPFGSEGTQDPRLVEIMAEWGFTWGGDWLMPDPMHFEYRGSP